MDDRLDPRALLDDLLEVSVIASFSRIGSTIRRPLFGWTPPAANALAGRTVLITGPTSGLGRQAAQELAALGARVVLVGRNRERLTSLGDALAARHGESRFPVAVADMASLSSVRSAAERVLDTEDRLDVVIDNAGAIFHERTISPDGIEATFATLVAGPFALVSGLVPLLERTPGARVIAVTSGGQYVQSLDLDDLHSSGGVYDGTRAYARSKRAQVTLVREWARRLGHAGIRFDSMHPGWTRTPGLAEALPRFAHAMGPILRSPAEGTDTLVWLATTVTHGAPAGSLWLDRRRRPFDRLPGTRLTAADRRRLWDLVVRMTGLPDPGFDQRPDLPRQTWEARMTILSETIDTALPIDEAFAYLADFANSEEWDPGVATARRLEGGPLGVGARFALGVRLGGRVAPMEYRISVFEPPTRVVLVGSGSGVTAVDDIRFASSASGTRVVYTADIRLGGVLRLVQPFLGRAFTNLGRNAARGMEETLEGRAADDAGGVA